MKEALIWSKDNCPHCVAAKHLLKTKGYDIEERIIGLGPWTKEQLLESVPSARSVPQIFLDDNYIGGYIELKTYFEEN